MSDIGRPGPPTRSTIEARLRMRELGVEPGMHLAVVTFWGGWRTLDRTGEATRVQCDRR